MVLGLVIFAGCGGGSSTPTPTPMPAPVTNTVSVAVNSGPANNAINFAYVSVTVCNPGSTTSCATISDVQVDTGSSGLRILASAPGVSNLDLTPVAPSGTPVDECYQFGDGTYIWGPVMQADVQMAGEKAAGLPIQIINSPGSGVAVPNGCSQGSQTNRGTVEGLQANGILGIGTRQQDCGIACTGTTVQPYYWLCPSTGCTSAASLSTAIQVSNPVIFFSADNNGVAINLPSIGSSGAASVTGGTLTFGIGTQTDNALGSANVYPLGIWPTGSYNGAYTIQSTYNSVSYPAFIDSAAPITLFLDPTTIGVPACSGNHVTLYCPSSTASFTVSNMGFGGTAANASISIGNAQTLLSNPSLTAFSGLTGISGTGASNDAVELGLPFFYGKTVYVGIAGKAAPSGVPTSAEGTGYYAF
ncbi:MAG TPA: DUF3443 family protein [Terriglobia bacterium]|nr:DUF3443 family protein [Terriglobia bacterium]